jgi:hypothetical protein
MLSSAQVVQSPVGGWIPNKHIRSSINQTWRSESCNGLPLSTSHCSLAMVRKDSEQQGTVIETFFIVWMRFDFFQPGLHCHYNTSLFPKSSCRFFSTNGASIVAIYSCSLSSGTAFAVVAAFSVVKLKDNHIVTGKCVATVMTHIGEISLVTHHKQRDKQAS